MNYDLIKKVAQCQRNWLEEPVTDEHLQELMNLVPLFPKKQNVQYFDCFFITDRDLRTRIYNNSWVPSKFRRNSQLLAPLVVAFLPVRKTIIEEAGQMDDYNETFNLMSQLHIGIASGILSTYAVSLGYAIGFCVCVKFDEVASLFNVIAGKEYKDSGLFLGIGKPNSKKKYNYDPSINWHTKRLVKDPPSSFIYKI